METSNEIINRASESNRNRFIYSAYGMDENGANFIYETYEFDNYKEAIDCYNSIILEDEGQYKLLTVQIIDKEGTQLALDYLLEDQLL